MSAFVRAHTPVHAFACLSQRAEVLGQLEGVISVLPPRGSQG